MGSFLIYIMNLNIHLQVFVTSSLDQEAFKKQVLKHYLFSQFLALLWESRAIFLSPPICTVSRNSDSFIPSGKANLLPLSFYSSPPCLLWSNLYSSFPYMQILRLGQYMGLMGLVTFDDEKDVQLILFHYLWKIVRTWYFAKFSLCGPPNLLLYL